MQVGEQGVLRPQHLDLLRLGLLDPEDHLRLIEDRGRVGQDLRALGAVRVIGDRAALTGARLDQDVVTVLAQLAGPGRGEGDAVLVVLDLCGDADQHQPVLVESACAFPSGELLTSKRTPRASSSANISSGSMQLSGGSAPRLVMLPRANSLTAAAAGDAVETIPPPRPQASLGGVTLRARITVVRPGHLDDVDGERVR